MENGQTLRSTATGHIQAAKHTASGVLLSEVETERVSWLWRGWLALGKLSVMDGDPGLGKSAAVLDIAARVSVGKEFPDWTRNEVGPGGVVVLSAEGALSDTIKPRLEAAGADLERITSLAMLPDGSGHERLLSIPEDLPHLKAEIQRIEAKMVIVDPLVAFFSKRVDSHKDQDVRRALAPLAAMAERTGAAVQLVRHLSKGEGKNPVYRGGGSIGIIGAARIGSLVAKDPKDEERRVLAPVKNNLAVHPKSLLYALEEAANGAVRVVWSGESEYSASELLQSVRPDRADARREAEDFLVSLLSDGPVPKAQVEEEAKAANISDSTLRRAKTSLGVIPERENEIGGERGAGRWVWKRQISKMLRNLPQPATLTQVSTLNGAPVVRIECCSKKAKRSKRTIGSTASTTIPAAQGASCATRTTRTGSSKEARHEKWDRYSRTSSGS